MSRVQTSLLPEAALAAAKDFIDRHPTEKSDAADNAIANLMEKLTTVRTLVLLMTCSTKKAAWRTKTKMAPLMMRTQTLKTVKKILT